MTTPCWMKGNVCFYAVGRGLSVVGRPAIYLAMQELAHKGQGSGVGVEGAHEAQFYGVAILSVGGLHVGKIVQGEADALVEPYAADAECIGGWLGLEDDGLAVLVDECFEGFATISLCAQGGVDGKVLDVDELLKVPRGEKAEGFGAVSYWPLAVGAWRLAIGCWRLAVSYWPLAVNNFVVEL